MSDSEGSSSLDDRDDADSSDRGNIDSDEEGGYLDDNRDDHGTEEESDDSDDEDPLKNFPMFSSLTGEEIHQKDGGDSDSDAEEDNTDDGDESSSSNPLDKMEVFSSLHPTSGAESSDSEDEGDASSRNEIDRGDEVSLPPMYTSGSPDRTTPTPAPKRRAPDSNGTTPAPKRRKTRKARSDAFIDSDDDNTNTNTNTRTPRHDRAQLPQAVEISGQSAGSSTRKQKSKATFTQTPLGFKPELKSSGKRMAKKSTPNGKVTPRVSRTQPTASTPLTLTPSSALIRNFTEEERNAIADAVEAFRAKHGMLNSEVNALIQQNLDVGRRRNGAGRTTTERLWMSINAACPGKDRRKVLKYCRKNFHNFKARGGQWTADEDDQLAELVESQGCKWALFSTILNRHPEDLRDRYRNYVISADRRETTAWTDDEASRLTECVQEAIDDIESSKDLDPHNKRFLRPIEQLINWQHISQQLGSRSRIQCLGKWRTMRDD